MGRIPLLTKADVEGTVEELSFLIIAKVTDWMYRYSVAMGITTVKTPMTMSNHHRLFNHQHECHFATSSMASI